jgi:hypothetical protein
MPILYLDLKDARFNEYLREKNVIFIVQLVLIGTFSLLSKTLGGLMRHILFYTT